MKKSLLLLPITLLAFVVAPSAASATVIFLTSGSSWTVPSDWNSGNNTIEVIGGGGGGGGGGKNTGGGAGGGAGAYAKATNATLTPNTTVAYSIGVGGSGGAGGTNGATGSNGGNTYFCNATTNCSSISGSAVVAGAAGGSGGSFGAGAGGSGLGGAGGGAASSIGSVTYSGGSGGNQPNNAGGGGGGGGAAGPSGAGQTGGSLNSFNGGGGGGGSNGGSSTAGSNATGNNGARGGNGTSGAGGGAGSTSNGTPGTAGTTGGGGGGGAFSGTAASTGGTGGTSVVWTQTSNGATAGPGGGGGGAAGSANVTSTGKNGAAGGLYGAGGSGGGKATATGGTGGTGSQGIIVITYTPSFSVSVSSNTTNNGNACMGFPGAFTLTRTGPSGLPAVTVNLSYSGATADIDYSGTLPTSVTIPASQASLTIPVTIVPKYSGANPVITATISSSPGYTIGTPSASITLNTNVAPPVVSSLAGYTAVAPATYPMPVAISPYSDWSGNLIGGGWPAPPTLPWPVTTPTWVSSKWYNGTPSPQVCYSSNQGSCAYLANAGPMGTRIQAITVTPSFGITATTTSTDLVSTIATNPCGSTGIHYQYVAPNASILLPKYSPIQVSYACQPSQSYTWYTYMCRNSYCAGTASTLEERIFLFSNKARVNGTAISGLSASESKTVSGTPLTFNLACGGYMPEDGTTVGLAPYATGVNNGSDGVISDLANGSEFANRPDPLPTSAALPPFYNFTWWTACWGNCYQPWSLATYGTTSPSYWHPTLSMTVQACPGDNDIVVNNVCQSCPVGQSRSGNACVPYPPPTANIQANGAGFQNPSVPKNGNPISVIVGQPVTVVANFSSYVPSLGSTPPSGKNIVLAINHAKVPSTLTNFPVYVNLFDLPPAFWAAETGSCGDIRVYASDGTTQLPREVVSCNIAAKTGELWFKAPSLSSALDTGFYINYGSGAADYAVTATYGARNVWDSNYKGVWHLPNGTTLTAGDSTANANNGTNNGGIATNGKVDGGVGLTSNNISVGTGSSLNISGPSSLTVQAWVKRGASNSTGGIFDHGTASTGGYTFAVGVAPATANQMKMTKFGVADIAISGVPADTNWHLLSGVWSTSGVSFYVDGALAGTHGNASNIIANAATGYIGRENADNANFPGIIDEVQVSNTPRTAAWIQAAYNNQSAPSQFYSVSDPLTATAINDDATGATVPCAQVVGDVGGSGNANCWQIPDTTKTYTFNTDTPGTFVFSAQAKTQNYTNYNGYASVSVTVTCWDNSHQVENTCVCDPHYTQQGNACVLDECTNNNAFPGIQSTVPPGCIQSTDGNFTCSPIPGSGYVAGGGECAPPGPPSDLQLIFTPARVRSGSNATITWTGTNVPPQCTISSDPAVPGLPMVVSSTITGNSDGVTIGPITQNTNITLTCPSVVVGSGVAKKAVGIIPVYREI